MKENENSTVIEKYNDRFGYIESGTFFQGLRCEYLLFALCIGVLVGGVIALDIAIFEPAQNAPNYAGLCALISLVSCLLWGCLWAFAANLMMSGYKCRYEFDKVCFKTKVGVVSRTIYYKDVLGVDFEGLTLFGRIRGYNVTVRTTDGPIRYRLVFPNRRAATNSKNTIFYVIAERAENLRRPLTPEPVPLAGRFDPEVDCTGKYTRGAEPLKGAITPDSGAAFSSHAENAVARLNEALFGENNDQDSAEIIPPAENRERQNPFRNNQADIAAMPAASLSVENAVARLNSVIAGGSEENESPLYSRLSPVAERTVRFGEADKKQLVGMGTMRLGQPWNIFGAAAVVCAAIVAALYIAAAYLMTADTFLKLPLIVIVFAAAVVGVILCLQGRRVSYRADGEKFVISDGKGGEIVTLFYGDVVSVEHKEMRLLWLSRGYFVTVATKYRKIVFRWLFPDRMKYCRFEETPFRIIIDRCPKSGPNRGEISGKK